MQIAIALFEGFDELDVFGPFEVLANAGRARPALKVRLATVEATDSVRSARGVELCAPGTLGEHKVDLLIVPGGGWNDRAEHGAWAEAQRSELPDAIRHHHSGGGALASVCTGAGILAAAGVLEGRPASTHHAAREDIRKLGVEIIDARVVDDGDVITAGGVTSGIDLALWIVEREFGSKLADGIATAMEYERRGQVHHGPRSTGAAHA